MDCSICLNGESRVAAIIPEYTQGTLYLWSVDRASLPVRQIRDEGPHISLSLSPAEFVSLACTGSWPQQQIPTPGRIFGQITNLAGRSACDLGSLSRYIDNVSFSSCLDGQIFTISIDGSTLAPQSYRSRTPEEQRLLSSVRFSITMTMSLDELPQFVTEQTTREDILHNLKASRAG